MLKKRKMLLSGFVILVFGIALVVDAGTIAINENFESTSVGNMPSGWSLNGSSAGVTDLVGFNSDKSLLIKDETSDYRPYVTKYGEMQFEETLFRFYFKLDEEKSDSFTFRLDDGSSSYWFLKVFIGDGNKVKATSGGSTVEVVDDIDRSAWTQIDVLIGTGPSQYGTVYSSTYEITVTYGSNSVEKTLNMYYNKRHIKRLAILTGSTADGENLYVDNVYLGDPNLVPEPITLLFLLPGVIVSSKRFL